VFRPAGGFGGNNSLRRAFKLPILTGVRSLISPGCEHGFFVTITLGTEGSLNFSCRVSQRSPTSIFSNTLSDGFLLFGSLFKFSIARSCARISCLNSKLVSLWYLINTSPGFSRLNPSGMPIRTASSFTLMCDFSFRLKNYPRAMLYMMVPKMGSSSKSMRLRAAFWKIYLKTFEAPKKTSYCFISYAPSFSSSYFSCACFSFFLISFALLSISLQSFSGLS